MWSKLRLQNKQLQLDSGANNGQREKCNSCLVPAEDVCWSRSSAVSDFSAYPVDPAGVRRSRSGFPRVPLPRLHRVADACNTDLGPWEQQATDYLVLKPIAVGG